MQADSSLFSTKRFETTASLGFLPVPIVKARIEKSSYVVRHDRTSSSASRGIVLERSGHFNRYFYGKPKRIHANTIKKIIPALWSDSALREIRHDLPEADGNRIGMNEQNVAGTSVSKPGLAILQFIDIVTHAFTIKQLGIFPPFCNSRIFQHK